MKEEQGNKSTHNFYLTNSQLQELIKPREPSLFEKIKIGVWAVSVGMTMWIGIGLWETKMLINDRIAYEAATQNVVNRYIGRLEGKGDENFNKFADVIRAMHRDIERETIKEQIKNRGKF